MVHRASLAPLGSSLATLLLAACGSKAATSGGTTMPGAAPTPPAGAAVVVEGHGDLDGKPGDEALRLYSDGTIFGGNWVGRVQVPAATDYFREHQASISVEVLDQAKGTRVVVIALPTEEDEDPPNRYQILAPRGAALATIYDQVLGVYGVTQLRFPGDGTVRYTEDSWTACGSPHGEAGASPSEPVSIDEITLALDGGGVLARTQESPSGQTFDCNDLAACPWIYVDGAAGPVRVGEILRDVRGRAAYALQHLALPAAAAGPLRVRVAEEEDEVTFLDEIYVEADGLRVAPTACATAAPQAYCVADHQPLRLARGDVLELTFDLPAATTPIVFARGYYVPTPSRARR
jgi:hypothetical protein